MTNLSDSETDLYTAELEEHLEGLDAALLALDGVHDPEAVDAAFRHLHSVKGGAASMGFTEVQRLAHRLEDAMCVVRTSSTPPSAELLAVAFEANDRFRQHLEIVQSAGWRWSKDLRGVQELIIRIGAVTTEDVALEPPFEDQTTSSAEPAQTQVGPTESGAPGGNPTSILSIRFDGARPLIDLKATAILQRLGALLGIGDPTPAVDALDTTGFVMTVPLYGTILESELDEIVHLDGVLEWNTQHSPQDGRASGIHERNPNAPPEIEVVASDPDLWSFAAGSPRSGDDTTENLGPDTQAARPTGGTTSLRVSVTALNLLADLAGELVTVRSRLTEAVTSIASSSSSLDLRRGSDANSTLLRHSNTLESILPSVVDRESRTTMSSVVTEMRIAIEEQAALLREMQSNSILRSGLVRASEDVSRVVGRLQEATIDLRLVPLESVFRRFRRVVRNTALASGKDVEFVIRGERTGVDKRLIDGLSEPLTHLVRNAIDHGIEPPEQRRRIGKPSKGHLVLTAAQQGNSVVIELSDDGRGINVEAVRGMLVADGRIDADRAALMSRDDVIAFLFLPGVTTKTDVTELSGRGVGLDVVQALVAGLHGTVELSSQLGRGTTVSLRLPSAMAIVHSLIVTVGDHRLGIPIEDVREVVRLDEVTVTPVGSESTILLRGEFLPVMDLQEKLQLPGDQGRAQRQFAVVVSAGSRTIACLIDSAVGTEDLVIKSIGESLGSRPGLSGASFLGDGTVALIVDPSTLAGVMS